VEQVIGEMGSADAITNADMGSQSKKTKGETVEPSTDKGAKRLYRDPDDVIVAGVASGIAHYFSIDPVIVRLAFVISFFFHGFGLFSYIILWLVVPKAETTAQKYAMRGERMTLQDIAEHVKKKFEEIDEKKISKAKGMWNTLRVFLKHFFYSIGKALQILLYFTRTIVGFLLCFFGALGIAGIVSVVSVLWVGENSWLPIELQHIVISLLSEPSGYILLLALFVTVCIPLLISIVIGASISMRKNLFTPTKTIFLGILWITAVTLLVSFFLILKPVREKSLEYLPTVREMMQRNFKDL
jgi:phage shock protein PspC (stress-responsive transcriptional regulator)